MSQGVYEDLLADVYQNGKHKDDRTGTGTRSIFGTRMEFDLNLGFPLITTKFVPMRLIVAELLWFLSGSTNNNDLTSQNVHIWDEWADPDGKLGPVYGAQWRSWKGAAYDIDRNQIVEEYTDQISELMRRLHQDPNSRRHIVSAWNVSELPFMRLAPCHALFQFDVTDGKVSSQLYQRSADMFLGVPFNIASYALLTHMVAQQLNLPVDKFVWVGGDTHIYENHVEQVQKQLSRSIFRYEFPTLELNKAKDIFSYAADDIKVVGYESYPAIKAPVAV